MSDTFINIAGMVITAIGTVVTCAMAYKAKTYRDEIRDDRLKQIGIELLPVARRAREECKKIMTPVGQSLRGVNEQTVIDKIGEFTDRLHEFEHRLQLPKLQLERIEIASLASKYKQSEMKEEKAEIRGHHARTHWTYIVAGLLLLLGWGSIKTGLFASDKEIRELTEPGPVSEDTKKKFQDRLR